MNLKGAQEKVDSWIEEYGVRYFDELTNLGLLMEEVGELARVITRKFGEQSSKNSDLGVELEEEMADVLFVLICLANQCDVDLSTALEHSIQKKIDRDGERHRQNPKLK